MQNAPNAERARCGARPSRRAGRAATLDRVAPAGGARWRPLRMPRGPYTWPRSGATTFGMRPRAFAPSSSIAPWAIAVSLVLGLALAFGGADAGAHKRFAKKEGVKCK